MKIGFASNDWSRTVKIDGKPVPGGSGWVRLGQYVPHLEALGHEVAYGGLAYHREHQIFGVHLWDESEKFDFDVIVLQRFMNGKLIELMRNARANGQIILQDVDDWYWGLSPHNAAFWWCSPQRDSNDNINHYRALISASSGVITSTPFLTEKMLVWNEHTVMHQNHVDVDAFVPWHHENDEEGKFVVGWMGSTSHRSNDLAVLSGVASQISSFANWHHSGEFDSDRVPKFYNEIGVDPSIVTTSPFLPPNRLGECIRFDVGVVPLMDIPFNAAKSCVKGLEYAAGGVPFVASRLPEYQRLSEELGLGLIAKRPGDFPKLLKRYRDPEYRSEVGVEYREKVRALDVRVGAKTLSDTLVRMVDEAR